MKFVFILHNIFEIKNGVSNKYIHFINYLKKNNIEYLLISCSIHTHNLDELKHTYNLVIEKGINIPFYPSIKIPNINYTTLYENVNENDILIFNGELFMFYDIFIQIKKEKNIKLIPNWHTNYDYYNDVYFKSFTHFNHLKNKLYHHLKSNVFDGLICTGPLMEKDFLNYTQHVFNANEICFQNFNCFKIDSYSKKELHFIYSGRISIEKNIDYLIDIFETLIQTKTQFINYIFKLHIIGVGPYLNDLTYKINKHRCLNVKKNIIFHGELEYHKVIDLYKCLQNRIFINPSKSETFGKSSMEACYAGIPLFCIQCPINNLLYNENNAFLFNSKSDFITQLLLFIQLNTIQKEKVITKGFINATQYDQEEIFKKWVVFINKTHVLINNKEGMNDLKTHSLFFKTIKWSFNLFEK